MNVTAETLERAIIFATEKHKSQIRKGNGRPYILHPISVMMTLMALKESKNIYLLAVVCILHDVVEDCNVTLEEIAKLFGYQVASIVEELTSDPIMIKELGKTEYLKQKMRKMSSYALCIKLVDRLENIKDMTSMNQSFVNKQVTSTKEILDYIEKERKLTGTHKKMIRLVRKKMKEYEPVLTAT